MSNPIDAFLGTAPPQEPTDARPAAWRAYFLALQAQLLRSDQALKPTDAYARVLQVARVKYLALFPGADGEADRLFAPGAVSAAVVVEGVPPQ